MPGLIFMNAYPDKTDQDVLRDPRHKLDVSVTAIKLYLPLIRYIKILSSVISVDQSSFDLSLHKKKKKLVWYYLWLGAFHPF